jgi:hypothetical protein
MTKTASLSVETDMYTSNKVIIHPNDGYDLKLYSLTYQVKVFANCSSDEFENESGDFFEGEIILSNDQTPGKVKLQAKYWDKIGKPSNVILYYNSNKLLISNA